jgi:hypothetical protein
LLPPNYKAIVEALRKACHVAEELSPVGGILDRELERTLEEAQNVYLDVIRANLPYKNGD